MVEVIKLEIMLLKPFEHELNLYFTSLYILN